jgi:SAM-dependent methyltransferase
MTQGCHVCGAAGLTNLSESIDRSVSSDCKPCDAPQSFSICGGCGTVQKRLDESWFRSVADIYGSYIMYGQSGGFEQSVFDQASGTQLSRSARLIQKLLCSNNVSESGRLLDVGCGNGAFLQAFNASRPKWLLAGSELDSKNKDTVEKLPMVEKLYSGSIDNISGTFDVVSLIHVLEHIINPLALLRSLHTKLRVGGLLFIESPSFEQNPFDLLIADHCTHFSIHTLSRLVESAGFVIQSATGGWVPKELSIVASRRTEKPELKVRRVATDSNSIVLRLQWLQRVVESAAAASMGRQFGIFGTSIAGSWLCSMLDDRVAFFVDEDVNRIGRTYMNRPIYSPAEAPANSCLFIAQPSMIAIEIRARLERMNCAFDICLPPREAFADEH